MRALLVVVGLCGSAGADERETLFDDKPRFEIAAGGRPFESGLYGEAGYRPWKRLPFLAHAMVVTGRDEDPEVSDPRHDEWLQVRGGVEVSACMEIACVFAMGNVGFQHAERVGDSMTLGTQGSALAAGRFGIEFGRFMYARIAFDFVKVAYRPFDIYDDGPPRRTIQVAIAMRF